MRHVELIDYWLCILCLWRRWLWTLKATGGRLHVRLSLKVIWLIIPTSFFFSTGTIGIILLDIDFSPYIVCFQKSGALGTVHVGWPKKMRQGLLDNVLSLKPHQSAMRGRKLTLEAYRSFLNHCRGERLYKIEASWWWFCGQPLSVVFARVHGWTTHTGRMLHL